MSMFVKSSLLSLTLLAGAAVAAHAQSASVAALPPGTAATAATAPIGPSATCPGPNTGSGFSGGTVTQQAPVSESPKYVGPSPGAASGVMPPKFEKSADYESNATLHPYSSPGLGPRPN